MRTVDDLKRDAKRILRDVIRGIEEEEHRGALLRHKIDNMREAEHISAFLAEVDQRTDKRIETLTQKLIDMSRSKAS